ncbi:MAG: hypothetical protein IPK80_07665 [Nannocystis sp.]|nr:hypothetical protein [Nannocystis sp.]
MTPPRQRAPRRRHWPALRVTSSKFSTHAVQAAQCEPNLKLVDGPKFVDMLAARGVLLQDGKFGELRPSVRSSPE